MEWLRRDFKQNSRYVLADSFGTAFGVIAIASILLWMAKSLVQRLFFLQLGLQSFLGGKPLAELQALMDRLEGMDNEAMSAWLHSQLSSWLPIRGGVVPQILLYWALGLLIFLTLRPLLEVGRCRWFSRNREIPVAAPFSLLFSLFSAGDCAGVVKANVRKQLLLFLWSLPASLASLSPFALVALRYPSLFWEGRLFESLGQVLGDPRVTSAEFQRIWDMHREFSWLFLIGQVLGLLLTLLYLTKVYRYYMVHWLLADNPQLGGKQAMRISRFMMEGQRWRVFLLNVSYLGWYVLAALGLVFAPIFFWMVDARRQQCLAEFYAFARDRAVASKLLRMEDLGYHAVEGSA